MVAPYSGAMFAIVARSVRRHHFKSGAIEFDEFIHHAFFAEHLRDGENKIGGSDAIVEFAIEFETDHIRQEHIHGLTEHHGFGFDAAHAPTNHAETVDHGGVRIGANKRIGEGIVLQSPTRSLWSSPHPQDIQD